MKKIIFMGTPEFAAPALKALIGSRHEIVAVYTAPPKPAGRGKELRKSFIHQVAEEAHLDVRTPARLKTETLPECDVAVVAAYGLLLPEHILKAPKYGCINIHPSLLPRWRGAAPLQRTVMAGDKETAVCIMKMDKGLDTGDVLAIEKFPLHDKITASELHDKCAEIGADMTLQVIDNIANITPVKQSEQGVTYAKKITSEDERINWNESATEIEQKIRGLNSYPGAYFLYNGEKIKVFEADVLQGKAEPGLVIDKQLSVGCGEGVLKVTKLQKQGKRAMTAKEFLNGSQIAGKLE
jgi:methionyl-tRNA formyltransferase